jgi:bifunctional non-homologous end joining protein LigD
MGAVVESISLDDKDWVYERKYDGIRVKVAVVPGSDDRGVEVWSRQGNIMTAQFPDLVQALDAFRRRLRTPILADGEIVAVDDTGTSLSFERLQGRIGLTRPRDTDIRRIPVALVLFDLLLHDREDLRARPFRERRHELERVFRSLRSKQVRLSRIEVGDGRRLYQEAVERGWEGIMAKRAASPYRSGKHHADWRKIKLLHQQ